MLITSWFKGKILLKNSLGETISVGLWPEDSQQGRLIFVQSFQAQSGQLFVCRFPHIEYPSSATKNTFFLDFKENAIVGNLSLILLITSQASVMQYV